MNELNFKDLRTFSKSLNTLLSSVETTKVIAKTIPTRTVQMRGMYPNMDERKIAESMQTELSDFCKGVRADYESAAMWGRTCGILMPYGIDEIIKYIKGN
mgnify:CR=1 FL=1